MLVRRQEVQRSQSWMEQEIGMHVQKDRWLNQVVIVLEAIKLKKFFGMIDGRTWIKQ